MTLLAAGRVNYHARMERAFLLSKTYPFAKEILSFYAHIAEWQRGFYESLPKVWGKQAVVPAGGLRSELRVSILLRPFEEFLRALKKQSPSPPAEAARELADQGSVSHEHLLVSFWQSGLMTLPGKVSEQSEEAVESPFQEFFARVFLQPYADFVSGATLPPVTTMTVCRCPRCEALPVAGVLRREGDGGKRFLLCSFCSLEWDFRRILCANCGEEAEQKLPVYVAEEFPHMRVECCDTCRYFLRTIDLTKDGNAIPLVDDLAAIPLSLWAEEHGYTRIQGNLLGT